MKPHLTFLAIGLAVGFSFGFLFHVRDTRDILRFQIQNVSGIPMKLELKTGKSWLFYQGAWHPIADFKPFTPPAWDETLSTSTVEDLLGETNAVAQ